MDLPTALRIFNQLETQRDTEFEGDPCVYDLRLDATTDDSQEYGKRLCRVRVSPAKGMGGIGRDEWQYVMETAVEHDVEVDVSNSALELR